MLVKQLSPMKRRVLGERGAASVEYLFGVLVVAFATWAAVSDFGQAAISGIKAAGLDILGL